jgi:hypothetical protein
LLNEVALKYDIKILGFGDSAQKGASIVYDKRAITSNIEEVFTFRAPKLEISTRPSTS